MPKVQYGVRYWLDRFPASRRPSYPQQRGDLRTDVAIVGGGAMGCVAAYVFAAAGVDCVLLEGARVGQGEASASPGIIVHEPETDLAALIKQHGLRDGRHLYQTARRGSLEYISAIKRLRIDCGLQTGDAVHLARGPEGAQRLQKEYAARRDAGLDIASINKAAVSRLVDGASAAIRTHENAVVDPYRATLGFAKAAAARNAKIFERSPVKKIKLKRKSVEIKTAGGLVTASTVALCSGYPTDGYGPLHRRFFRTQAYAVLTPELPAAVRRQMPPQNLILRDTASPDHWLRWVGNRVLWVGGSQPKVPDRAREKTLVQNAMELMYELSVMAPAISGIMPEYAWDIEFARTIDGVPFFGPHRNYPRHLFAFGAATGGLGLSFAAARIMLRSYLGKPEKGDEPFSFTRIRE